MMRKKSPPYEHNLSKYNIENQVEQPFGFLSDFWQGDHCIFVKVLLCCISSHMFKNSTKTQQNQSLFQ